jgi:hypothetical protein
VLFHLDAFLNSQWPRFLKKTIREANLADVVNEAGKVGETLLLLT